MGRIKHYLELKIHSPDTVLLNNISSLRRCGGRETDLLTLYVILGLSKQ